MVETSPNKDSVKEKAYDFLSSKKITVQLDSYSEKTENIVGIDYRVISFCQNTKTIDVVIDHDEDSSLILKTEFIKTKTLKHFLTVIISLFYIITIITFFILPSSWVGKILLFSTPIAFGYFLYYMAYKTAKIYLKKLTDTITFSSAAIAAATALCGVNLPQYLYDHEANGIIQIILFLILQTFSIFATTKCLISWGETIEESRRYYKKNEIIKKKAGILKNTKLLIISALLYSKIRFHKNNKNNK
ncbi:hypothetical protein P4138_003085 [Salmonella enterica]|nr:hypothetical protein [Salmonella enterica]